MVPRHPAGQHRAPRPRGRPAPRPQKMETVGQLTGASPTTSNNLLTGVIPAQCRPDPASAAARTFRWPRQVKAIRQATERGAALTRQLLALLAPPAADPAAVDLNALVRDFTPLIRQAVGDAVSVSLEPADAPATSSTSTPAQMESALLNLAVNASATRMDGAPAA
ncbi:hypothetical protein ACRAWD_28880 [Caulobacter segnis]